MKKKIVWNSRAISRLVKIQTYLSENWSEAVQKEFILRTFNIVELWQKILKLGLLKTTKRELGVSY